MNGESVRFDTVPRWQLWAWDLAAALLVLVLPSWWRFRDGLATVPDDARVAAMAWAAAFLALTASLRISGGSRSGPRLIAVPIYAGVVFGVTYFVLAAGLGAPVSRIVAAIAFGLAIVLALAPLLLGRWLGVGAVVTAIPGLLLLVPGRPAAGPEPDPVLATTLHRVTVTTYRGLVDSLEIPGGALARTGDSLLLVTGEGEFYRLRWAADGRLTSRRIPLRAQFDRDRLRLDLPAIVAVGGGFPLRTADLAVDTTVTPHRVYLAYGHWNADDHCLTLRVAAADLPDETAAAPEDPWQVLFESWPCVAPSYELGRGGTGARLAWAGPGRLLLSIGDHGMAGPDGQEGPQARDNAYGKVFRLDTTGRHELFTTGHRNPQGLVVRRDGTAWSTEHGPQGGDEVNRLVPGGNYGWPLATYGVQYGQSRWPLAGDRRDHAGFEEPALAFVPAIGISNLIEVGSRGFPAWDGDLLVSSLRQGTLYRLRVRQDRVIYAEPMPIGRRIRDLEETHDGRIVLWTDDALLLVLSPSGTPSAGERAYQLCAGCHGADLAGTPQAPPLSGIVGREVATADFPYTQALRAVGGRWTADRLNTFLRDPARFAPGTTMITPGVTDSLRFLIIAYLRDPNAPPARP